MSSNMDMQDPGVFCLDPFEMYKMIKIIGSQAVDSIIDFILSLPVGQRERLKCCILMYLMQNILHTYVFLNACI